IDLLDSQRAIKRYEELSGQFAESRENQLCKQLMQAMEMGDPDGFTEAVQQFDKVSRLDQWHVAMLVKVKRRCGDGGEGFGMETLNDIYLVESAGPMAADAHGLLNAVPMDGAFLVRYSSTDKTVFVVSLRIDNKLCHYRLKREGGRLFVTL
uniref:SH2 domain-containing protein n=1 Tax=Globodera pallida TaxID=36090 RepID=A0A183CT67_GLOPA